MTSFRGNEFPGSERHGGFTLLELLTVMAIIALIGGLSAGAYQAAKRNYSLAASAGRIQGIFRAARNTSLSTGEESFVVVDPGTRNVTAHAFERVGEWSFEMFEMMASEGSESGSEGISPDRSTNHGASLTAGMIGKGLDFRSPGAYVDCGSEARFDLRTGVRVEAWVRHYGVSAVKAPASERKEERTRLSPRRMKNALEPAFTILRKSGAYALGMTEAGALEGVIGDYAIRTEDGVVAPERWVRVTLRFDGGEIELTADGVPREAFPVEQKKLAAGAQEKAPEVAPITSAPLTISSLDLPFPGAIDEVKLSGAAEPLVYRYSDYELIIGWKKVIHFDRQGHLDPRCHTEGVRLVLLELPDVEPPAPTTKALVDYSVTFDDWLSRWDKRPALIQSVEEANLEAKYASARKIVIEVDLLGVVK